jgi:hypothetical protein
MFSGISARFVFWMALELLQTAVLCVLFFSIAEKGFHSLSVQEPLMRPENNYRDSDFIRMTG